MSGAPLLPIVFPFALLISHQALRTERFVPGAFGGTHAGTGTISRATSLGCHVWLLIYLSRAGFRSGYGVAQIFRNGFPGRDARRPE